MFLENKMVDDRISRAIDNDHTAAMKAPGDSKKHMRKKGSSGDMISVCMTCKKAFKNPLFYRKHMRQHAEKALACHLCGKSFERKHHLQSHLAGHAQHQQQGKHPFQCQACGKRFGQKGHLTQHLKFHEKDFFQKEPPWRERPFECEICKKRFNIKSSLQRHMSCHTGEKPFLCAICNRGYTRRSVLVLHIQQVHENRKPFQCEECQLCFSQKGNLQAHFRRKHLQPKSGSSRSGGGSKSKRAHKRPSKAIKICANKNYAGNSEDGPSLHSYASKAGRGAAARKQRLSPKSGSSSCEEEERSYYVNLSSLESSSSCSTSDEAAAGSSGDDVPVAAAPDNNVSYDIKSLSEFESLLDVREWEEHLVTDSDHMLCSLLPNYDLSDALASPSKSNVVLTRAAADDDLYAWSDYPLFTAEDLEEIKDIGGANYFVPRQNSKTANSFSSFQKLNFNSSSSLQA
ncbi:zinc finger protein 189-like [Uloborus diversus]|uniref:zinc finger protein 189-like n=1 Tax=Uloborus diversus TaxID=327109 RepID=UPI002409A9BE|nr:zinc finger protein 189-like [Uloborus diversus]